MKNLSVKARLNLLVIGMAILLLAVGALGFHASSSAVADLQSSYEHQTVPMREVARLRRLHVENENAVFKSFQHNPAFEYAKLHDHPLSLHLDAIEKNLKWAEETWEHLGKDLLPDSPEGKLAQEIRPMYNAFVADGLRPTLERLKAGDFSADSVAAYLKVNGSIGAKMNKAFMDLAEIQQNSVKAQFEASSARSLRLRNISVAAMVAGILLGLVGAALIIRSIVRPLERMRTIIDHAAVDNDFTGQIEIAGHNEIADTAHAFNQMMSTLRDSLTAMKADMIQVDDALNSLAASAEQAARASASTSESASAMAASVEQMSVSITSVSESTKEAEQIAEKAGDESDTGGKVIADTVAEIGEIATLVNKVSNSITALGESSDRISTIVQVIKDVADQTNLLALNAAIEAARAGDTGRGFAVVADEVRKLAERTTAATGEIAAMIDSIQTSSHQAVETMHDTVAQIGKGTQHAHAAGEAIVSIRHGAEQVVNVVHDIADAMSEQGSASQEIARRVENVARASEESNISVRHSATAVSNIREVSNRMRATVERFKV